VNGPCTLREAVQLVCRALDTHCASLVDLFDERERERWRQLVVKLECSQPGRANVRCSGLTLIVGTPQ